MLRLTSLGSLFLIALASGCGSSVDHASAVKVMNSALSGTVAAGGQVVSLELNANGGQVDAMLTNLIGGGTAHVTGTVTHNNNVTTIDVDVTFKDWTDPLANVTLNGGLHEAGTFSSPLPTSGDIDLTGALAVTGSVKATVDFDLHGKYSPTGLSVNGDVGGQSILNVQIGTP